MFHVLVTNSASALSAVVLLLISYTLSQGFLADAVSVNAEASKIIAEAITSGDDFVIGLKNTLPHKWKKEIETIAALEFPGAAHSILVRLDRERKQVGVSYKSQATSSPENKTLTLGSNFTTDDMKLLLIHVKQTNGVGQLDFYANCIYIGSMKSSKTFRDVYLGMRNPQVAFLHERKYEVSVDSDQHIDDVLLQNGCTPVDVQAIEPAINRNKAPAANSALRKPQLTTTLRSDLPPPSECDYNSECCTIKMSHLTDLLIKLQQELALQRAETQELRKMIGRCLEQAGRA